MKQKHIDASREARLWIGQVIVPAFIAGAMFLTNDKAKAYVSDVKEKVVSKFRKKQNDRSLGEILDFFSFRIKNILYNERM